MSNFLNSISAFIARHMEGEPRRSAEPVAGAADGDTMMPSPRAEPALLPSSHAAAQGDLLAPAADGGHDGCDVQLPLVPLAAKARPSRALSLQRASTSIALPSRAPAATRNNPARPHDSPASIPFLTETERARLQVMQVQIRLHSLALYEGPIDGVFNPETVTGVRHFQTLKGLRPTGTLAAGTLSALGVRPVA